MLERVPLEDFANQLLIMQSETMLKEETGLFTVTQDYLPSRSRC
jgi:hypothetical protein